MQPGRRTVQGVLEAALGTILRTPVQLTVAGRTDAGVHATGQVAHFDVPAGIWAAEQDRLLRRLAGVLSADVRVRAANQAPPTFDARFAALWRRYEYLAADAVGDPRRRGFVLGWPRQLDVAAMAGAAGPLLGEHDFVAFCRFRQGASSIRTLQTLRVERVGEQIAFSVQADAFCHSMVRSLVGALLAVGDGRRPVDWPASLLERPTRADEVTVAPAHGLTLVAVGYPPDGELSGRVATTRQRRQVSR